MPSQVFYRKWRPQTLAEVVGQNQVTQTLVNALASGRVAHAYLFGGPRGTGKTSTARILAKALNCLNNGRGEPCNACSMCQAVTKGQALDLLEIDAASNRGIDEIRDLKEKVNFAPNLARYKVYIIDEAHMLTEPAFNALLKTLEEPPAHVVFVLATTEVHKVPPTILSRCQRFDFRRIPQAAVVARLGQICDKEGIYIEPQTLSLIARSAAGSLRDAENLLEQLAIYYGPAIALHQVQIELGLSGDRRIRELAGHILTKDVAAGLATINNVAADGLDLRGFTRELVEYLRGVLLVRAGAEGAIDLSPEELVERKRLGAGSTIADISKAIRLLSQIDLRSEPQSTLPLELVLVDCALPGAGETEEPVSMERAAEEPMIAAPDLPAPAKAAEVTVGEAPGGIEHIRHRWKDFVNSCRGEGSSGNLDALLRGFCRPMAIEKDTLVLGFSAEFHKSKIEDPKYRHLVEKKLNEVFQTPYRVRCILIDREQKAKSDLPKGGHLIDAALRTGARIIDEERVEK